MIDLVSLGSVRNVRHATRAWLRPIKQGHHDRIDGVVFLSLPADVYRQAACCPGPRSSLFDLLGVSGAGLGSVLLVPCASIQSVPTRLLSASAGPVLGIHFLYGPAIMDLSRETAVICAPPCKRIHHLYEPSRHLLHRLLWQMGHGRIVETDPDSHDRAMSDVQFLTHSLLLVLADLARAHLRATVYRGELMPRWMDDALQLAQRVLAADPLLYRGIALDNPFNEGVMARWASALHSVNARDLPGLFSAIVRATASVSAQLRSEYPCMLPNRDRLTTPLSRARDWLTGRALDQSPPQGGKLSPSASLHGYQRALRGDYAGWFRHLGEFFPERAVNHSSELIDNLAIESSGVRGCTPPM